MRISGLFEGELATEVGKQVPLGALQCRNRTIGERLAPYNFASPPGIGRNRGLVHALRFGVASKSASQNRPVSGGPFSRLYRAFSFVIDAIPRTRPFVLLAESFSTPLAVKLAATNPSNLKGLIICAGFIKNPVTGWLLQMKAFIRPFFSYPAASLRARVFSGRSACAPRTQACRASHLALCVS